MRFFKRDNQAVKQEEKSFQDDKSCVLSDAELAEVSGGDKKTPPPPPPQTTEAISIPYNKIHFSY